MKRRAIFGMAAVSALLGAVRRVGAASPGLPLLSGRTTFENTPADRLPVDAEYILERDETMANPGRPYIGGMIAIDYVSHVANSCAAPIYIRITAPDDPNANLSGFDTMPTGVYVNAINRGRAWLAPFHTDARHYGTGATLGGNAELKRYNQAGTVGGWNAMSDQDSGPYPANWAFQAQGKFLDGLFMHDGVALIKRDDLGVSWWGQKGHIRLDDQGNTYIGPVKNGHAALEIMADGRVLANGKQIG